MTVAREVFKLFWNLFRILAHGDRAGSLARLNQTVEWHLGPGIPTLPIRDLVGGEADADVTMTASNHPFELPLGEKASLMALVRHYKPQLLFEMGTFTGATTVSLARAAGKDATVHTIDLPDKEIVWGPAVRAAIGRRLTERTESDASIIAHRCNTKSFDFAPFERKVDFVYIDASHEYHDVLHDSNAALRMVRPGGIVVWDDYQATIPGVVRALRELSRTHRIFQIELTRLAVLRADQ